MIIDCHTHVFSPRVQQHREDYIKRDACFALLYSDPKSRIATADELITGMDEAGVDASVIAGIGWTRPELCREANDYVLEAVARYPGRLIGLISLQPGLPGAVAELERCLQPGIKGIGEIRPDIQQFDLGDERVMAPVVEVLRQHRLTLLTHASEPVGHDYPGKGSVTPDVLYRFIRAFPELSVVCAHWGGGLPFYALMPEVKQALGNVFFDTAASPFLYHPDIYNHVIGLIGAERVLFGSDFPLLPQTRLLEEIRALAQPEAVKELMLSANARRLFNLG